MATKPKSVAAPQSDPQDTAVATFAATAEAVKHTSASVEQAQTHIKAGVTRTMTSERSRLTTPMARMGFQVTGVSSTITEVAAHL